MLDAAPGVVAGVLLATQVLDVGEHALGVARRGGGAVADGDVRQRGVVEVGDGVGRELRVES